MLEMKDVTKTFGSFKALDCLSLTVPNWYDEGKEVTIPLDLRFSPSQNAQNFFKNYKKKQTAARMLVDLLAEGEKEIITY